MSVKGRTEKPFIRVGIPKTWMIWVRLNCLKSSGQLVTSCTLDTTVKVETQQQQFGDVELQNPSVGNNGQ